LSSKNCENHLIVQAGLDEQTRLATERLRSPHVEVELKRTAPPVQKKVKDGGAATVEVAVIG